MARKKGTYSLSANIEVNAAAPLDARTVVDTLADLTTASNFPYPYIGMPVWVKAARKQYVLTADDVTNIENWHEVGSGSGGSDNVVEGYYKTTDGKFYEESTYTTEITGADKVLYISLDTNILYRFNGSAFVIVSAESEQTQVTVMPTASVSYVGKVYQYIGATDANYTHGYFYECKNNSGTYEWENVSVQDDNDTNIQVTSLPTASASELGKIYQFVGTNSGSLTKGYFYKCVSDGESTPTYSWEEIPVQEIPPSNETISLEDFNALTQEEKDNGTAYYIYDAEAMSNFTVMGNRFDKANIYTEDERMIGSYLGKPLYQRVVINTTCTVTDLERVIKWCPVYKASKNWYGGAYYKDSTDSVWLTQSDNVLTLIANGNDSLSSMDGFIIQYTKTNDATVNIGTGNDYSTDEQIIGTWIDGKPLYQKTIEISNVHINNNSVTIADASGLNIIDAKGFIIEGIITVFLNDILLRVMVTNNNLALYSTLEWNISNGTIIIQYTKTTD